MLLIDEHIKMHMNKFELHWFGFYENEENMFNEFQYFENTEENVKRIENLLKRWDELVINKETLLDFNLISKPNQIYKLIGYGLHIPTRKNRYPSKLGLKVFFYDDEGLQRPVSFIKDKSTVATENSACKNDTSIDIISAEEALNLTTDTCNSEGIPYFTKTLKDIEEEIRRHASHGYTFIRISGILKDADLEKVKRAGYKVYLSSIRTFGTFWKDTNWITEICWGARPKGDYVKEL